MFMARVGRTVVRQAHGSRTTISRFPIGSIGRSQILTVQLAPALSWTPLAQLFASGPRNSIRLSRSSMSSLKDIFL